MVERAPLTEDHSPVSVNLNGLGQHAYKVLNHETTFLLQSGELKTFCVVGYKDYLSFKLDLFVTMVFHYIKLC